MEKEKTMVTRKKQRRFARTEKKTSRNITAFGITSTRQLPTSGPSNWASTHHSLVVPQTLSGLRSEPLIALKTAPEVQFLLLLLLLASFTFVFTLYDICSIHQTSPVA